jgi:hypothetical protein
MRSFFQLNSMVMICLLSVILLGGCDQQLDTKKDMGTQKTDVVKTDAAEDGSTEEAGYLEQANKLFKKAKDAGQTTASNAGDWISDQVSGAMDATGTAAQGTGDWVSETFDSLKNNGMTSANNATEWVQEDIQNMNAFEYKVVPKQSSDEAMMNKLGKERWDCFAVDATSLYYKRQRKSYLRNVPVKDLLKFLPMGGGDGE